jgi:hypothetical protein
VQLVNLYMALRSATPEEVSSIVEWAIDSLALQASSPARVERRAVLRDTPMPGLRQGGLAAFEDEALGSVYGQVLLQVLLRVLELQGPATAWPLIEVGLGSDIPLVRRTAAQVMRVWPKEAIRHELRQAVQGTLAADLNEDEAIHVRAPLRMFMH